VEFDRLGGLCGSLEWCIEPRGEETPVRAFKLCTDHDIKPFICGLVMCILLTLDWSMWYLCLNGETEQSVDLIEIFLLAAATTAW